MTESITTSPLIAQPRLVFEAIAASPQAASTPQHLSKGLLCEQFALTQQLHRAPHELRRRGAFARRGLVQPCLVSLFERYQSALHDISISDSESDITAV